MRREKTGKAVALDGEGAEGFAAEDGLAHLQGAGGEVHRQVLPVVGDDTIAVGLGLGKREL